MDFSWVKQLAEQTNQLETQRLEREKKAREENKTLAVATCPFVEKLSMVIFGATEEFNKNCIYPHLRIQTSKLYKHSRTGEASTAEPDEVAHFSFYRRGYMYGIRGVNGLVEFVQIPVGDTPNMAIRLHELGVSPRITINAELDRELNKVRWSMDGSLLDGTVIISLCQKFFVDFIEQSNLQSDGK